MQIKKILVFVIMFFIFLIQANGQKKDTVKWNDRKCAVALTYDDALGCHLDIVAPLLDSLGLNATFYVYGNAVSFHNRIEEWRSLANNGHELGNHSLFHPCNSKTKGNEWVKSDYDMDNYSINRILDEIRLANTLFQLVDGETERTYAYPCGNKFAGDSLYMSDLHSDFIAARGVTPGMNSLNNIDLFNIRAIPVDGYSYDELVGFINKARKKEMLIVFVFHGIDEGHSSVLDKNEHRKLLEYLKENRDTIWTAPVIEIVNYINDSSSGNTQ
ncbi:MAG: polysaccharide deacetylase family protein [Bacteroidales bacterium]